MEHILNMKDFARYIGTVSFDKALHQVRQLSLERIIENESAVRTFQPSEKEPMSKTA